MPCRVSILPARILRKDGGSAGRWSFEYPGCFRDRRSFSSVTSSGPKGSERKADSSRIRNTVSNFCPALSLFHSADRRSVCFCIPYQFISAQVNVIQFLKIRVLAAPYKIRGRNDRSGYSGAQEIGEPDRVQDFVNRIKVPGRRCGSMRGTHRVAVSWGQLLDVLLDRCCGWHSGILFSRTQHQDGHLVRPGHRPHMDARTGAGCLPDRQHGAKGFQRQAASSR